MARPSSNVGYFNIGTTETSSPSKIESEIEAIEATGDSNEVCNLDRKECDVIMEHLKNNPGLVVKSLDSEGRIVLHVAVMTGKETIKLMPPTSECTDKGLRKAADDSHWYRALKYSDCNELMALLQANPCLVAQTGPEGKTVLHAAAEQGCLILLQQVFDLFNCDEDLIHEQFVDEMSGVKIALLDLLRAKWGPSEVEFQNIAWFTLPRNSYTFTHPYRTKNYDKKLNDFSKDHTPLSSNHKLFEITQRETSTKAFEDLEEMYQFYSEGCYIGLRSIEEMQFHIACKTLYTSKGVNYLKTIINGFLELETSESAKALIELFQVHNEQGKTPFHTVRGVQALTEFLKILPKADAYKACVNVRDVRGWTNLHCVAATKRHKDLKVLLEDERIDVNARTSITDCDQIDRVLRSQCHREEEAGITALHLAILHDDITGVELFLQNDDTDVNALLYRWIVCGYERTWSPDDQNKLLEKTYWTPLQLAAIMGRSNIVRALLEKPKVCNIYDDGKLQNSNNVGINFRKMSPLLLASASGNPDTLRLFLDNPKFDPLVKSKEGATALHYATNAMIPLAQEGSKFRHYKVGPTLYFSDFGELDLDTSCRYEEEIKLTPESYSGRQACIIMLLQAGVDIWEKDKYGRLADPGPEAPKESLLWWHEQMARETLEAKKSLNDAANAISVVAALVATASFVGPLQPPLGYGGDSIESGVQDTHLSVRVFMVSNILSFYFAIASILFAVVPSLPMPQEGIYVEWKRTRRSVGVAIFFLLMSVLGVLISFGTASNSVVSEDYSWKHAGLSFYPTLLGGIICILGILLFFIRLLRLVFHRNAKIRSLYKTFVKF